MIVLVACLVSRPYLNMQAMRSAQGDWWHGDPMPMRFAGRFLVRNQVVAMQAPEA